MPLWKIACVQMDCRLADKPRNLTRVRAGLQEAAGRGAKLVVFPECALTGYGWVDEKAGIAHIPIDEAIKIVAARGLPQAAPSPPPAAPSPSAAAAPVPRGHR